MQNERHVVIFFAVVVLIVSILACNAPQTPTPNRPPDTVTPYPPATARPQDAPTSEPSESVPTEPSIEPTETPTPTLTSPTSTSAPTSTPTPPVSEGPLDFEEPRWVHAWRPREEGSVWVTVKVQIIGGAPPFTIYLDGTFHGTSTERLYLLEFPASGCGQIVHSITVKSADGDSKTKDFWLGGDLLLWCD
ncbi:MAG: hypothetical protein JW918_20710 [Anaerolineae bacterium]|nr:hypothetical protein [Anaerolineae bacterium]